MDFAEMERVGWSDARVAQTYADQFATASQQAVPGLVTALGLGPGSRVLDLCCGQGIVSEGLKATGADVTGLDFSPAMITMARARVPGVSFIEGNAMAMPFEAGRFDGIAMGFGMPHVPDPEAAMVEVARVLKPGGRFAYSVWQGVAQSGLAYVFQAAQTYGSKRIKLPEGPGPTEFADPARAIPAMEAAGFGDVTLEIVDSHWKVEDPAALYEYFLNGTVRGAALLKDQPYENQMAIRQAVIHAVETNHGTSAPIIIPIPSVVVSGTRV